MSCNNSLSQDPNGITFKPNEIFYEFMSFFFPLFFVFFRKKNQVEASEDSLPKKMPAILSVEVSSELSLKSILGMNF